MMRTVTGALVAASLIAVPSLALRADDGTTFQIRARLSGDNEVPPNATTGQGQLRATVDTVAQEITFELTYSDLEGENGMPPLFAHIHFGPRFVNGGVMVFFCGGGGKDPCPSTSGGPVTITGTITAAGVVGPTTQGINPGDFDDVVTAIRKGLSYANIHTDKYKAGEIRGKVIVRGEDEQ